MTSDEKIYSRVDEDRLKDLVAQELMDLGIQIPHASASISSERPRARDSYPTPRGVQGTDPQMVALDDTQRYWNDSISAFNSHLLWISGPGTNNLVLAFFLSNPKRKYSKEDVFAHLNRECEEQGISEFFAGNDEWAGMNWDFSLSSKDVKNKSGLKIGRSTILRVVENLKNFGLLKDLQNGKYRLERGSAKVAALQNMIDEYPWHDDDRGDGKGSWTDLEGHIADSRRTRKRYTHLDDFENLIRRYLGELEYLKPEKKKYFRSKLSRLSHYCELEEDESYSSVSRQIIGHKEENNLIIKILNEKGWDNTRLRQICVNIGHEENSALSRKTKNKLISYIVKNSP